MKYVSRFLKKKYDKELVYVRKYLNTKIEYYNDKWPTNFLYNEIQSKENIDKYVLKNISLQKKKTIIIMMIIMIIIIIKARFDHKIKISSDKFDESDESDDYDEENGAD